MPGLMAYMDGDRDALKMAHRGGGMGFLDLIMGDFVGKTDFGQQSAAPAAAPGTEAPAGPASLRSTPQWWQTWRAKNGGAPPVRGLLG
jgi:hypothetical protein